jgi:hypothetical protein
MPVCLMLTAVGMFAGWKPQDAKQLMPKKPESLKHLNFAGWIQAVCVIQRSGDHNHANDLRLPADSNPDGPPVPPDNFSVLFQKMSMLRSNCLFHAEFHPVQN